MDEWFVLGRASPRSRSQLTADDTDSALLARGVCSFIGAMIRSELTTAAGFDVADTSSVRGLDHADVSPISVISTFTISGPGSGESGSPTPFGMIINSPAASVSWITGTDIGARGRFAESWEEFDSEAWEE